jgi:antitoxin MazE
MRASLAKWGNSLAVRLPKDIADSVGFREGAALELTVEDDSIVLRRRRYDIGELVAQMDERAMPPLEFDNTPHGSEEW